MASSISLIAWSMFRSPASELPSRTCASTFFGFHGQDGFGPGFGFVEAARAQQVVPRSDLDRAVIRQQVCGAHVFRERARQVPQLLLRSGESETRRSKPTVDLDRIAILDDRLARTCRP